MRRSLSIFIVLLLSLSSAEVAVAKRFKFIGAGFGHGVGMSQYGAYGLAQKGWGRDTIIRTYYRGTNLQTQQPPKSTFRIGILQSRTTVNIKANRGSYDLVLETSGQTITTVPQSQSRKIVISGNAYQIFDGDTLVGGQSWGGPDDDLEIVRSNDGVVRVAEWGHRSGRGKIELDIVASNKAHVVVKVDPEEYLYGLGEVPSSWPMKVLEVQADAARTYGYRRVADNPDQNRSICSCGLLSDTRDQNYVGLEKETKESGDRWVQAVKNTNKQVITLGGQLVTTYYSSSSGGMIEAVDKVWGGAPQPHLKAGCDPGDFTSANPNRTWSDEYSATGTATKLHNRLGWGIAKVTGFRALSRGASGRVLDMQVRGKRSNGTAVTFQASGETIRKGLGLKSTRFWVNRDRIVKGPIRNKYDKTKCRPGLATGRMRAAGGGNWQRFQKGRIFTRSGAGTHYLHGLVLRRYRAKGGPKGRLGYPTTDVRRLSGNRVRTRFQHGRITCDRDTDRCKARFF